MIGAVIIDRLHRAARTLWATIQLAVLLASPGGVLLVLALVRAQRGGQ
jgi:hypothetical protein